MITVIDYGLGNLKSVSNALERAGVEVCVTSEPAKIAQAKALILPGVGAFSKGMENLKTFGILHSLYKAIEDGRPFLGICLGMQLLFSESEEHGLCRGLDIIKGKVIKFGNRMKIPHMGWNQVNFKNEETKNKLFKGIEDNSDFYFVHSYYAEPADEKNMAAATRYGKEFASVVIKDNVIGMQFHPEKSAEKGLRVLKNFADLYL